MIDAKPNDMADFAHLPVAAQHCDPSRPTTAVRNGANLRRWEFMLLPGETTADFADPARVWELLDGHMAPDQGEIVRYTVYTFRSLVADTHRAGHVLIAGDAAHLMPPFMGEGMCSGMRDAANLAWKLDLVLRYRSPDTLLDRADLTSPADPVPTLPALGRPCGRPSEAGTEAQVTPEKRREALAIINEKPEPGEVSAQKRPRRGPNPVVSLMRVGMQAASLLKRVLAKTNPELGNLKRAA